MALHLQKFYLSDFISDKEYAYIAPQAQAALQMLTDGAGPGSEFRGWIDLPANYDRAEYARVKAAAERIKAQSKALIVIGIGGSYLGARAAIEFIKSPIYNNLPKDTPDIYFSGNTMSSDMISELLEICEHTDFSVNVISKSGTTTEPAVAFRLFRELLEHKYGVDGARERIYVTTDKAKGALKKLATDMKYESFTVPDDIGGRYSVLTSVGLLPIAVSGADIDKIMQGAALARTVFANPDPDRNDCLKYAALRNVMYRKGKTVEMLSSYEPYMAMMNEWWKQLFGESEGKDKKGLFPASAIFSTDLHSLGQYIQDGMRILFETVVTIGSSKHEIKIGEEPGDIDELNYLAGRNLHYVNGRAFEGTVLAHSDGGVPNIILALDARDEENFGYMVYFFELACAISGYMLGINPFDQPGVESYKRNMFALLEKPGYEAERDALRERIRAGGKK